MTSTMQRAVLLGAALVAACSGPTGEPPAPATPAETRLIAHRGGVVGDDYAENSPAALEAAVERGYWMAEVDIRESADGVLVVHHDPDFRDFYDDPRLLAEMSWDEISELRANPGGSRPLTFAELCRLASGRIRLMLDVKPPEEHSEAFYQELERSLSENGLLETAYVIGTQESRNRLLGRAKVGVGLEQLEAAAARGEDLANRYFLFEHGRDLTPEMVEYAQSLNVAVVPSINIFHYDDLPDHRVAARADVERMLELGVTEFQIDSPYDVWLR